MAESTVLPPLKFRLSPNHSKRNLHNGHKPFLIVVHRPVGSYHGSVDWLCNPKSQASCHVITEGNKTGADEATQLVPWNAKAWHAMAFNDISYGVETDDNCWDGTDKHAFDVAARIVAFLCKRTGIPPHMSSHPLSVPGVVRHFDLGRAGGGHSDPTTDPKLWLEFMRQVQTEYQRGGFRRTWGRGRLERI